MDPPVCSEAGNRNLTMKPAKNHEVTGSGNAAIQRERARLLAERERIMARLQKLDEQEIASLVRPAYLDLLSAGRAFRKL
jgi:hypothetical protein